MKRLCDGVEKSCEVLKYMEDCVKECEVAGKWKAGGGGGGGGGIEG